MVDDIQFEDLPDALRSFIKTRTYIDAINMNTQKDIDLFRNKLRYAMPEIPLKKIPKEEPNPEERNNAFPPLFNRLNRYREYNARMARLNPRREEMVEEVDPVVEVEEMVWEMAEKVEEMTEEAEEMVEAETVL